jgi:hypothetical protein
MIPIIDSVLGIVNKFIPDQDTQARVKMALIEQEKELEKNFNDYSKRDHDLRIKEIEFSGFKASWRPYVMFGFSTVVIIYCIIYYIIPGIVYYFTPYELPVFTAPVPKVDPALWDLVKYSILGIGGMRTLDKGVRTWRDK